MVVFGRIWLIISQKLVWNVFELTWIFTVRIAEIKVAEMNVQLDDAVASYTTMLYKTQDALKSKCI